MSSPPQFRLPDLLGQWPWPRKLNQHYQEVKAESEEWLRGFEVLDAKLQRAFDICDCTLIASHAYPSLDKDCLRVSSDLMMIFLLFDEFTDKSDGDQARTYADIVADALRNPHTERPQGESKIVEMTRQFWLRAIKVSSEPAQRRFIKTFTDYLYAVANEASDRTRGHIRNIADYFQLRKLTAATYATLFPVEMGLDIPDEVIEHPVLQSICRLTTDSLVLTNDLYSYNIEQAAGHGGHNLLTAVMNEKGIDLDGALDWLAKYNDEVLSDFLAQRHMLPSWDPDMDRIVNEYVDRLGWWIRGLDSCSFESRKYFGTKGAEIKEHRMVTLLPQGGHWQPGETSMIPSMIHSSAVDH